MNGRTMGRYSAPGGTITYRPSIIDIQGAHAPLCPHETQRDKVATSCNAGRPIHPSKPPAQEAVETCRW